MIAIATTPSLKAMIRSTLASRVHVPSARLSLPVRSAASVGLGKVPESARPCATQDEITLMSKSAPEGAR